MSDELTKTFDLNEVAESFGMSPRWVRQKVKDGAEHLRFGHKIRFTAEQVEKLRAAHVKSPAPVSMTTGPKRRAS